MNLQEWERTADALKTFGIIGKSQREFLNTLQPDAAAALVEQKLAAQAEDDRETVAALAVGTLTPEQIEVAYFDAHKAAERDGDLKAEDFRLTFEPESGKYVCEKPRVVPGQRQGLKNPKTEAVRYEYDEGTVLIMIRSLRSIARGEPQRGFACNPKPNAGAFL